MSELEKRYLKFHFSNLEHEAVFPANYQFIQLYTNLEVSKQGRGIPIKLNKKIKVNPYKIPEVNLFPSFCKPISKCFEIDDYDREKE